MFNMLDSAINKRQQYSLFEHFNAPFFCSRFIFSLNRSLHLNYIVIKRFFHKHKQTYW